MPDVGVGAAGLADGGLVVGPSRCRRRPALSGALPPTRREQQGREPTRASLASRQTRARAEGAPKIAFTAHLPWRRRLGRGGGRLACRSTLGSDRLVRSRCAELAAEGDLRRAELLVLVVVRLGEEGHERLLRRTAQHLHKRSRHGFQHIVRKKVPRIFTSQLPSHLLPFLAMRRSSGRSSHRFAVQMLAIPACARERAPAGTSVSLTWIHVYPLFTT